MARKRKSVNIVEQDKSSDIPQDVIDKLARMLLPEIQKYFESQLGKADFDKWKDEQREKDAL